MDSSTKITPCKQQGKPINRGSSTISRQRGYKIRVIYRNWYSVNVLLWLFEPPLEDWQRVISNPNVRHAYLTQSGKLIRKYDPDEDRRTAPLETTRAFSLMR